MNKSEIPNTLFFQRAFSPFSFSLSKGFFNKIIRITVFEVIFQKVLNLRNRNPYDSATFIQARLEGENRQF